MSDLERVLKGLMCCAGDGGISRSCPEDCPYHEIDEERGICESQLMWDAAELLGHRFCPHCGRICSNVAIRGKLFYCEACRKFFEVRK